MLTDQEKNGTPSSNTGQQAAVSSMAVLAPQAVRWHLGHLDALRGMAILGVVLVHSALVNLPFAEMRNTAYFFGQRGVQLFFVVSAFTLFLSYKNRKTELAPTRNFFLRRFFRLAPLFYPAIVAAFFYSRPLAGRPLDILLSVLFLNGFSPHAIIHGALGGWSIADEAIFYMLLPLLYRWIDSLRAALYALVLGLAFSYVASHGGAHFTRSPELTEFYYFFGFLAEFPVFLMGIVAFYVWEEFALGRPSPNNRHRQLSTVLLVSITIAAIAELPSNNAKLWAGSMLCATLLLALCLHPWKLLVNRATIFLGKISFSVYLLHFYFVHVPPAWVAGIPGSAVLLGSPLGKVAVSFSVALLITCPLATLTWLWIEQPGIRLGRRLIAHLEHRAAETQPLIPSLEAFGSGNNTPDAQF